MTNKDTTLASTDPLRPSGLEAISAAQSRIAGSGKIVCVVSGGNVGVRQFIEVLEGKTPQP